MDFGYLSNIAGSFNDPAFGNLLIILLFLIMDLCDSIVVLGP